MERDRIQSGRSSDSRIEGKKTEKKTGIGWGGRDLKAIGNEQRTGYSEVQIGEG